MIFAEFSEKIHLDTARSEFDDSGSRVQCSKFSIRTSQFRIPPATRDIITLLQLEMTERPRRNRDNVYLGLLLVRLYVSENS